MISLCHIDTLARRCSVIRRVDSHDAHSSDNPEFPSADKSWSTSYNVSKECVCRYPNKRRGFIHQQNHSLKMPAVDSWGRARYGGSRMLRFSRDSTTRRTALNATATVSVAAACSLDSADHSVRQRATSKTKVESRKSKMGEKGLTVRK